MRINSSSNVGIGTTAPGGNLHVQGAAGDAVRLYITDGDTTGVANSLLIQKSGTLSIISDKQSGSQLLFGTANTERMRINSSGLVGIGTTAPAKPLQVEGSIRGGSPTVSDNYNFSLQSGSASLTNLTRYSSGLAELRHYGGAFQVLSHDAYDLILGTSSAERMRIDSSGNLLVGTTSATTDLAYSPKLKLSGNGPGLYFEETDTSQDYSITALGGKFYIRDATAVVPRLTIDSSGNVGIGTSSPTGLLTIGSGVPRIDLLEAGGSAGFDTTTILRDANTLYIQTRNNGSFVSHDYMITTNASGASSHQWRIANSEKMRIDSSGNVGIGTSSPAQLVQISKATSAGTTSLLVSNSSGTGGSSAALKLGVSPEDNSVAKFAIIHERLAAYGGGDTYFCSNYAANTTEVTDADAVITIKGSTGNVGIGTTSPDFELDVSGTTDPRIVLQSTGTASTDDTIFMNRVGGTTATNQIWFGDSGSAATGKLQYDHSNNAMTFHTNGGTERMRIDSSGNVGIGISSPVTKFHVLDGTSSLRFRQNGTVSETLVVGPSGGDAALYLGDTVDTVRGGLYYDTSENALQIRGYNNSTRIIIDSSGNVGIGTTSSVGTDDSGQGFWFDQSEAARFSRSSNPCLIVNRITTDGTVQSIRSGGVEVGSISVDSDSTAYNTSSDYRLKENVVGLSGAIDRVKLLKPSRFNFIANPDRTVDGFVAHEVSDIVPEAVHGEKDAVDADGNPEYQGIDQSKLVPVLTAALQEALTKIEALEARIVALETA